MEFFKKDYESLMSKLGNDFNLSKSDLKKDFEEESGDFNDSEKEEKSLETIITKESEKPAK